MRRFKTSTTAFIKRSRFKRRIINENLTGVFNELKDLLKPYEQRLDLRIDLPHHYELWTLHRFRGKGQLYKPRGRIGLQFASISINKKWISLYLLALYKDEKLKCQLPDGLKLRLDANTKSGINIHLLTDELKIEIQETLKLCWEFYKSQGWVETIWDRSRY